MLAVFPFMVLALPAVVSQPWLRAFVVAAVWFA
jgi:hypothetical protein